MRGPNSLATIPDVHSALNRCPRTHPGRRALTKILASLPDVATDSGLEVMLWRVLKDGKLPAPTRQFVVRDASGTAIARVDLAYPHVRLAIEADGFKYHSSSKQWAADRERQNALVMLGWTIYRVTWDDATRKAGRVISDVANLLASLKPQL